MCVDVAHDVGFACTGDYCPVFPAQNAYGTLMQENMGNGAAVADIDCDGYLDVLLLGQAGQHSRLFHNEPGPDGGRRFTDITEAAGLGLFAIGLLASGLASSSVGAYAGAMIMQGLLHVSIPLVTRRLITLTPALAILAMGLDPSRALVLSQVVLSFGIPFALVPLLLLTRREDVMGTHVNRRATTVVAAAIAALISALNLFLLIQAFGLA